MKQQKEQKFSNIIIHRDKQFKTRIHNYGINFNRHPFVVSFSEREKKKM